MTTTITLLVSKINEALGFDPEHAGRSTRCGYFAGYSVYSTDTKHFELHLYNTEGLFNQCPWSFSKSSNDFVKKLRVYLEGIQDTKKRAVQSIHILHPDEHTVDFKKEIGLYPNGQNISQRRVF